MEIRIDAWCERHIAKKVQQYAEDIGAAVVVTDAKIQDLPLKAIPNRSGLKPTSEESQEIARLLKQRRDAACVGA